MKHTVSNPNYYKINLNGQEINEIDIIQQVVNDFGSVCQSNILRYSMRANKKHDTPLDDVRKIIKYAQFWENHLLGRNASYVESGITFPMDRSE